MSGSRGRLEPAGKAGGLRPPRGGAKRSVARVLELDWDWRRQMTIRVMPRAALLMATLGLAACGEAETSAPTAQKAALPRVSVVTLQPAPRPYVRELPGRIAPVRIAEVRARVSGIVVERAFRQGADVKAGDILYRLDPRPYEVERDAAQAALAKAEAVLEQAEKQARRVEELVSGRAASQVQHETAIATFRQAQADVAARKADVARTELNLGYAAIRSPINGRVGRALVTEGALVGQGEATHLATVQQLDSVYADFTQSVDELNQLRRDSSRGRSSRWRRTPPRCGCCSATAPSIRIPASSCSPTPASIRRPGR
jgi:membrane fusion protein, multidrug efflux system